MLMLKLRDKYTSIHRYNPIMVSKIHSNSNLESNEESQWAFIALLSLEITTENLNDTFDFQTKMRNSATL